MLVKRFQRIFLLKKDQGFPDAGEVIPRVIPPENGQVSG
jgi:hypothetical protein